MADYKSKFTGEQIDALLELVEQGGSGENAYFYTVSNNIRDKVYSLEPLTEEEGVELYTKAYKSYKVVFKASDEGSPNSFFSLGYNGISSEYVTNINPVGVFEFVLFETIAEYEDGQVYWRGYAYRFTLQNGEFIVTEE